MNDGVHSEAKDCVRHGDVPKDRPVDSDADDCEEEGRADPLDHVPDSHHHQRQVVYFTGRLRIGQLTPRLARYQTIVIGVQVDTGNATDELYQVPESDGQSINQHVLVEQIGEPVRFKVDRP